MIIINAIEPICNSLSSIIGQIASVLLPIGNKKLIEHQINCIKKECDSEKAILLISSRYQLCINQKKLLDRLSIDIIQVKPNENLVAVLLNLVSNQTKYKGESIRLLNGGVLPSSLPKIDDCLIQSLDNYASKILYVSFANVRVLLKTLQRQAAASVLSINQYNQYNHLNLIVDGYQQEQSLDHINHTGWHHCFDKKSYFNARTSLTTQRSFNSLKICNEKVTKSSNDCIKIQAESNWFIQAPRDLSSYLPKLLDFGQKQGRAYYCLQYLPYFPLNELYVHGQCEASLWHDVFANIKSIFTINSDPQHLSHVCLKKLKTGCIRLYRHKTLSRLQSYAQNKRIDLQQNIFYEDVALGSIEQITDHCIELASSLPFVPGIMHGDLCFSNLLYDATGNRVKMIDPRGVDMDGNLTIHGNLTYDLAKLAHSIVGMYDFIIAGEFEITPNHTACHAQQHIEFIGSDTCVQIQKEFFATEFIPQFDTRDILPAVVLLFLSMLPLHADRPDRQRAMLLNAFRLYKRFVLPTSDSSRSCSPTLRMNDDLMTA